MVDKLISDLVAGIAAANTEVEILLNLASVSTKETIGDILDIIAGDINVDNTGASTYNAGSIVNADINASAAIASSKLATVAVAQGGTGVTSSTGTINTVLSNSPTLVTPALGTPASGVMTNMTGLPEAGLLDNAVTLAKMAGGTDGNLITYDACGNPAFVATGTCSQVLTSNGAGAAPTFQAAAGGGGGWCLNVKSSDQTKNCCTCFTTITSFQRCLDACSAYAITAWIGWVTTGTADIKFHSLLPASVTRAYSGQFWRAWCGSESIGQQLSGDLLNAVTTAAEFSIGVQGLIQTACAGSYAIQFAQNASDAGNTTILKGSFFGTKKA